MEHFRCLPTSEEFKKLSDIQLEILLINSAYQMTKEEFRESYFRRKNESLLGDGEEKELLEKELRDYGYSEEELKKIFNV